MLINKTELQKSLEIVKPGLANKEIIEQATSFAFIGGRVVTYNDRISISHPVEGLELEGAIPAENFYKFLNKIKEDNIELKVEGSEIKITSGRSKAGITLQSEITLPLNEELVKKGKWKDLPKNFNDCIRFVMTACTSDASDEIYTCVHVNKEGFTEASDRYRIARYEMGEEMPVKTFLLPASSAVEVTQLNPTKVSEGKGWIHFQTEEGTIISCRIVEGEFPNTNQFLQIKGTKLVLPKSIEEVLDRAMIFSKRDHILDEKIMITMEKKRFKIRAEAEEGWFEEDTNIRYEGETLSFDITPYLLKGILSKTQECELTENKLKFEGEGWIYITVLRSK